LLYNQFVKLLNETAHWRSPFPFTGQPTEEPKPELTKAPRRKHKCRFEPCRVSTQAKWSAGSQNRCDRCASL